jgi:hypothetical protein
MFPANQETFKTAKRREVLTEVNHEDYLPSGMSTCVLQETGTNSVMGTASSMSLSYSEDEAVTCPSQLPYVLHARRQKSSLANEKHKTSHDNYCG